MEDKIKDNWKKPLSKKQRETMESVLDQSGYTFSVATFNKGRRNVRVLQDRPCFGELRRYGSRGSFDKGTRSGDPHPHDLPRPMSTVDARIRVYISLNYLLQVSDRLLEFLFSPRSPWGSVFKKYRLVIDRPLQGRRAMVKILDPRFDPTVLVSLLLFAKQVNGTDRSALFEECIDKHGMSETGALLMAAVYMYYNESTIDISAYFMHPRIDMGRFFTQNPRDLSSGLTWMEGDDYSRPELPELFYSPKAQTRKELFAGCKGKQDIIDKIKQIEAGAKLLT